MKKTFQRMCCLFIILLTSTAHGQLIAPEFQTSMASPDNSALIKNVENNMNYYDGTLQIQIPLYTLKEFDLEVPISLMYKTGGIKIEDVATSVGLGWNLSAGGKITRIIKRNPDEASDGYFKEKTLKNYTIYILERNRKISIVNRISFILNFPIIQDCLYVINLVKPIRFRIKTLIYVGSIKVILRLKPPMEKNILLAAA